MAEADERFKAIAYDPRFQRFPKAKSKVKVDDRFKDMFENPEFQVGSTKDKRGKRGKKKLVDEVRRYYRIDDDDDDEGDKQKHGKEPSSDSESGMDEADLRWARMRGLAGPSSSSESSSEFESEGSDDEDHDLAEDVLDEDVEMLYQDWGVGAYAANPNEDIPLLEDATKRLACVDLDWEHVKAVDILAALRSFVPDGGRIVSVTVYPSDYGLEKMEGEKNAGPTGIWKHDNGDDDEDDDGALDTSKLRYYEKSKLRWYYAVVACSNVRTAEVIYNECDGMELMKSANVFDLRFIPDDQSFEGRKIRDVAEHVPSDYVAPIFQTKALQHTNVELTWDKPDDERKKTLAKKLKDDELKDEDFKTYLASASDDSDEDNVLDTVPDDNQEAIRDRYKNLLLGSTEFASERKGKKEWGVAAEDADTPAGCVPDKNMELQVTFEQDLEILGEKLATKAKKKKNKGAETVWEAYMKRRKEKKEEAKRKGMVNYHSSDEADSDSEIEEGPNNTNHKSDDPFDDPFFTQNDTFQEQKPKSKRSSKQTEVGEDDDDNERRKAELEMLLMDNDTLMKKGKISSLSIGEEPKKKLTKKERMKLAKQKKRAEREDGSDNEDLEAGSKEYLNMHDPRFQEVFENPAFALDPTDPRFAKAGAAASKLASEVAKRRSKKHANGSKQPPRSDQMTTKRDDTNTNADLKLMVASLKRKSTKDEPASKQKKAAKKW